MRPFTFRLVIVALASTVFFSCKKKEENKPLDNNLKQFYQESNDIKSESDIVNNDINSSIKDTRIGGRVGATYSSDLCGVTIDTSQLANKILIYNFDGVTPCFSPSRTRSGQIKAELINGNNWSDMGAVLKVSYINYKVTRLSDNKTIMFNGVKTLKNITGVDWLSFFFSNANFQFQERALNIQITLNNNTQAVWNTARLTTWDYVQANAAPGIPYAYVKFTTTGDTTINGIQNSDSWGTNQFNQPFSISFQSPWVSNTYCGLLRPNSGVINLQAGPNAASLTLGVDQSGNPSTLSCAYGYKVTWTPNGGTQQNLVQSY